MLVRISGPVAVHDHASEAEVTDPERLKALDGIAYDADKISDHFGPPCVDAEIEGGVLTLRFDAPTGTARVVSEFATAKKLSARLLTALVRETTGQWSDGIGEACSGAWATSHGVVLDFLPDPHAISVEQLDTGSKPPRKSPLLMSAFKGHLDKVVKLIAKGEPLEARDANGFTPLHLAILGQHEAVARALIEAGADTQAADRYGSNALSLAGKKRLLPTVTLILSRGHPVEDGGPQGMTPLMWAANGGDLAIVDALLAAGAALDARSSDPGTNGGRTALMFVGASHLEVARHLLSRGADPTIRDNMGHNASQHAARNSHQRGFEALVALIEAAERQR